MYTQHYSSNNYFAYLRLVCSGSESPKVPDISEGANPARIICSRRIHSPGCAYPCDLHSARLRTVESSQSQWFYLGRFHEMTYPFGVTLRREHTQNKDMRHEKEQNIASKNHRTFRHHLIGSLTGNISVQERSNAL